MILPFFIFNSLIINLYIIFLNHTYVYMNLPSKGVLGGGEYFQIIQ